MTGPLPDGGPAQSGSDPARADPAVAPASIAACFPAAGGAGCAAITAVPVAVAGYDTGGVCHIGIGGTFTVRPCTACTGTGFPAFALGGPPNVITPNPTSSPAIKDPADTMHSTGIISRRHLRAILKEPELAILPPPVIRNARGTRPDHPRLRVRIQ